MSLDKLLDIVREVLEAFKQVEESLARFEESLVSGSLADVLGVLEARYRTLASLYPPAMPHYERVKLLKRYVEALMVRARLYGLRGFFREADYIEGHVRELRASLENLYALLKSSQRGVSQARGAADRFREYPVV